MNAQPNTGRRSKAFSLIELMVVMAIIVILILVAVPSLKSITKGNGLVSASNLIRAMIANARSIAISQHRQAGVVFFEETATNSSPVNTNQTAMQLIIEDANPADVALVTAGNTNTIFVYYSKERQYLSAGLAVVTLDDNTASPITFKADILAGGTKPSRVILFDANGQMILRNGISRLDVSGAAGTYPRAYGDWNVATKNGTISDGVSSPGLLIYDRAAYNAEGLNLSVAANATRYTWLKNNGVVLIVNTYTGGLIQ